MTQTITLPLDELIEELLGNLHHRSVSMTIAQTIFGHFKNKSGVVIQWETADDHRSATPKLTKLERPILWRFNSWQESNEKWDLGKKYEHKRRVQEWIKEENTIRLKKFVEKELGVDGVAALAVAGRLVSGEKWQQVKALGYVNIITKEEELK